jgi:hypothetical protein
MQVGAVLPVLTKRRAVDFCRVTTALCPAGTAAGRLARR